MNIKNDELKHDDTAEAAHESNNAPSNNPSANNIPAVSICNVQKKFGSLSVLKNINVTVLPGTVNVILGPSGSGKSTLLRLINQLETLTAGSISIYGERIGVKPVTHKGEQCLHCLLYTSPSPRDRG